MRYVRNCVRWSLCAVIVLGMIATCSVSQSQSGNAASSFAAIESQADALAAQKNYAAAFTLYMETAQQGSAYGQFRVGLSYLMGNGVAENYAQAMSWSMKSATQGNKDAQGNVGYMYLHGVGVAQDYVQAMSWYMRAANQGDPGAEFAVGIMYMNGLGVAKNPPEARAWYQKAADQGYQEAQNVLAQLNAPPAAAQPAPAPAPAPQQTYAAQPAPAPQPAPVQHKDLFGAIAVQQGHGMIFGWVINVTSQDAADTYAMRACNADGCAIVQRFEATCAAYAIDQKPNQNQPTGSGWAVADTVQAAQSGAMAACQNTGGTQCFVQNSGCTDGF